MDISAELIHISVLVYQLLARKLQRADLLLRFIPFSFFPVSCIVWSLIYLLLFYPWLVFVFESTTLSVFALCCSVSVFVKYLLKKKEKKRDSFFFNPEGKIDLPRCKHRVELLIIVWRDSWFCFMVLLQGASAVQFYEMQVCWLKACLCKYNFMKQFAPQEQNNWRIIKLLRREKRLISPPELPMFTFISVCVRRKRQ